MQKVLNLSHQTSKLLLLYLEASVDSVDDIRLPSRSWMDENCNYKWDKEIYPEDAASFLANVSSITHD